MSRATGITVLILSVALTLLAVGPAGPVGATVGAVGAVGATAPAPVTAPAGDGARPAPCSPDESSSCTPARYAAQRFPSGRLGTAAAADPGDVMKHPRTWFRLFKKKYHREVTRLPARAQEQRASARSAWNRLFTDDGCTVEHASYKHYHTSTKVCGYNSFSWSQPPIPDPNFDNVKRALKMTLCLGGVAVAFVGGNKKKASTMLGAVLGGAACSFDFLDHPGTD